MHKLEKNLKDSNHFDRYINIYTSLGDNDTIL